MKRFVLEMKNSDLIFDAANENETTDEFIRRVAEGVTIHGLREQDVRIEESETSVALSFHTVRINDV